MFSILGRVSPSVGRSFLDPRFELLERGPLEAEYRELLTQTPENPKRLGEVVQSALFFWELETLEGRIHAAAEVMSALTAICRHRASESDQTFLVSCAIAMAEGGARASSFKAPAYFRSALELISRASSQGGENEGRIYAEGRLALLLPSYLGQNLGRAYLHFEMLARMSPTRASPQYWIGRIALVQGNLKRAQSAFEKALSLSPDDVRSRKFRTEGHWVRLQEKVDGIGWGIFPSFFIVPPSGVGGRLSAYDDRLFDTDRGVNASVAATTSAEFFLSGEYRDSALVDGVALFLQAGYRNALENFYGIGGNTGAGSRALPRATRWGLGIEFKREFLPDAYLSVGAKSQSFQTIDPLYSLTQSEDYWGMMGALGYDSRDSAYLPRNGVRAEVRGVFPSTTLGSAFAFEKWSVLGEGYFSVASSSLISFHVRVGLVSPSAPFFAYPEVSHDGEVPGIRTRRLVDRFAETAWIQFRQGVFRGVWVSAFLLEGAAGASVGSVPLVHWGGGAAVDWFTGGERQRVHLELSRFAGETLFQALLGASL